MSTPLMTCCFILGCSLTAAAQASEPPNPPVPAPADDERAERNRVTVGLMEYWHAELDTTDAPSGVPFDGFVTHAVAASYAEYRTRLSEQAVVMNHAVTGLEIITLRNDGGFDGQLNRAFVWEVGTAVEVVHEKAYAFASVVYRRCEAERDVDPGLDLEYEYEFFRITARIGGEPEPGIRPYFGYRYTFYKAKLNVNDADFSFELDRPYGVSAGTQFESERLTAFVEVMFLDVEFGFMASIGAKF